MRRIPEATPAFNTEFSSSTVVHIVKRENPFVMIDRETAQDRRLSWEARGMLLYLLSLPPDWEVRVSHLQTQGNAGRDVVRRMLKELQRFGYVSGFGKGEQDNSGRFGHAVTVYESPRLNPYFRAASAPTPENPSPVQPTPERPAPYKEHKGQRTIAYKVHRATRAGGGDDVAH